MAANHRLAERDSVDFGELASEPFVTVPAAAGPWRDWWLFIHLRGETPRVIGAEVTTPDEWFAAISAGAGIAITPLSAASYYARPGIVYRPVNGLPSATVGIVRRADDTRAVTTDFVRAAEAADYVTILF